MERIALLASTCGVFYVLAVLFGAPFFDSIRETLFFSCFMTMLTSLPLCFAGVKTFSALRSLLILNRPERNASVKAYECAIASIFGAWVGAFVIPLDWDRPWQVWPIPCCIGAATMWLLALGKILLFGTSGKWKYHKSSAC